MITIIVSAIESPILSVVSGCLGESGCSDYCFGTWFQLKLICSVVMFPELPSILWYVRTRFHCLFGKFMPSIG